MKIKDKLKLEEAQHKKALRTIELLSSDLTYVQDIIKKIDGEPSVCKMRDYLLAKIKERSQKTGREE